MIHCVKSLFSKFIFHANAILYELLHTHKKYNIIRTEIGAVFMFGAAKEEQQK